MKVVKREERLVKKVEDYFARKKRPYPRRIIIVTDAICSSTNQFLQINRRVRENKDNLSVKRCMHIKQLDYVFSSFSLNIIQ